METRSRWISRNGAAEALAVLGYTLCDNDIGYEGLNILEEHEMLFEYEVGSPQYPGELTLKTNGYLDCSNYNGKWHKMLKHMEDIPYFITEYHILNN